MIIINNYLWLMIVSIGPNMLYSFRVERLPHFKGLFFDRMKEEEDSVKNNLKAVARRDYGDSKREIIFKNKRNKTTTTTIVKQEKKQRFMTTLPDGTHTV